TSGLARCSAERIDNRTHDARANLASPRPAPNRDLRGVCDSVLRLVTHLGVGVAGSDTPGCFGTWLVRAALAESPPSWGWSGLMPWRKRRLGHHRLGAMWGHPRDGRGRTA